MPCFSTLHYYVGYEKWNNFKRQMQMGTTQDGYETPLDPSIWIQETWVSQIFLTMGILNGYNF